MEKYNYNSEEAELRKRLRNMRILATSLLVFMTVVFVIFKHFEYRGLLFSSIAAFAEASMVGALADWFAVVALFRHPLGLKIIPHTAIIQNNKPRIAEALSNFVVSNFFTPQLIRDKLDRMSVTGKISEYIGNNREKLANSIADRVPAIVDSFITDDKIKEFVKAQADKKIGEIKLYPLMGTLLEPVIEAGYHKPVVKAILNSAHKFIGENKEETMLVLGGINKTLTMPIIGDMVYKKILEFIKDQADQVDTNPSAEINKLLLSALPELIKDMQNNPETVKKGEQLKAQFVSSPMYDQLLEKLSEMAIDFKNSVLESRDGLSGKVDKVLELVVREISGNDGLRENIDAVIADTAEGTVSMYGSKGGELIYDTMDGWETKDMVDKLEVQVGADLQYIRINGTVIGGLVGLVIHFVSLLL